MLSSGTFDWWETPLSGGGYKNYFITQGSWQNDTCIIPIDCSLEKSGGWDRWLCIIRQSIWVRIVSDESYEVLMQRRLPEKPFRGPFFQIVGSAHLPVYEGWLRDMGRLRGDASLKEYWIASMENEVHILASEEPSFEKIKSPVR